MQKKKMSMEEYIQKIKSLQKKEQEEGQEKEEKSPAWMLAELYV